MVGEDYSFAERLKRKILLDVYGEEGGRTGLLRQILGSGGGENFHFMRGMIVAYETVLADMQAITREMNNEEAGRYENRAMN